MKLSAAERILLVQDLWDTVAEDPQAWGLTESQRKELNRRLKSLDVLLKRGSPLSSLGSSWTTVKKRIMRRS